MPDLPTLTVTDAQATRLLSAFGNAAGYRQWLKAALKQEVVSREERMLADQYYETKRVAIQNLLQELPE